VCFVHIPKANRDKLDLRAHRCVFLGYSPIQKGYKCYNPTSQNFYVSKDVTFVESQLFFGSPQVSSQGETVGDEDQDPWNSFPNLESTTPSSSELDGTDQPPNIAPYSSPHHTSSPNSSHQNANCNEQVVQQLPSPIMFKGLSLCIQKKTAL